jgi:hypothetical protein
MDAPEKSGPSAFAAQLLLTGFLVVATTGFIVLASWLKARGTGHGLLTGLLFGYAGIVGAIVALWGARLRSRGLAAPMRAPVRRYMRRFLPAMGVYVVVLFASMRLYRTYDLATPLLWLIAVAPALPLIAAITAIGLYLKEEDDEFQRTLAISAHVLATGLMLAILTVWGFLEQFQLVAHIPAWSAFPLLALCLIPSQAIVHWRYR